MTALLDGIATEQPTVYLAIHPRFHRKRLTVRTDNVASSRQKQESNAKQTLSWDEQRCENNPNSAANPKGQSSL